MKIHLNQDKCGAKLMDVKFMNLYQIVQKLRHTELYLLSMKMRKIVIVKWDIIQTINQDL